MTAQEADANEEQFLKDCRKARAELDKDERPRTAEELLALHDRVMRESAAKMPGYPRE